MVNSRDMCSKIFIAAETDNLWVGETGLLLHPIGSVFMGLPQSQSSILHRGSFLFNTLHSKQALNGRHDLLDMELENNKQRVEHWLLSPKAKSCQRLRMR